MSNDKAIVRVFKLWAKIAMMVVDGTRDAKYVAGVLQIIVDLSSSWREEDGIIYFSVTSDGTTGEAWITRLESKGFRVGGYAKQVLRSVDFKPTSGVTTEVAVLKATLFEENGRITKKIRAEAGRRNFTKPNAELACLIREKFTDEEIEQMNLWHIIAMHEPINDFNGDPGLLGVDRTSGGHGLSAASGNPDCGWDRSGGFAFAVSQVSSQS